MTEWAEHATMAILTRVAADGVKNPYECAPSHSDEAVHFVLGVMDTCVLARSMTFWLDGTATFCAEVQGRSLFRIEDLQSGSEPLVCNAPEIMEDVRAFLKSHLCDVQHIKVTRQPIRGAFEGIQSGVRTSELLAKLGPSRSKAPSVQVLAKRTHGAEWEILYEMPGLTDVIVKAGTSDPRNVALNCLEIDDILLLELADGFGLAITPHASLVFASAAPLSEDREALLAATLHD